MGLRETMQEQEGGRGVRCGRQQLVKVLQVEKENIQHFKAVQNPPFRAPNESAFHPVRRQLVR